MKCLLLSFVLLGVSTHAFAQAPLAYEFLTLIESESRNDNEAKLLFAPDFQGKEEMKLEGLERLTPLKNAGAYRRNLQVVNQQLAAATAAGWELVSVGPSSGLTVGGSETRYLLRRVKR